MVQQPVETILTKSWRLLNANWAIIVPGLVAGLVAGVISGFLTAGALHANQAAAVGFAFVNALTSVIVWVVATVVAISYTTGMAQAAWQTGKATFEDGRRAFREDAVNVFFAMLFLIVIGIVAAMLAPLTLGISLLADVFFLIYTMPAVIVGRRTATEALAESCRIAVSRFVPTLLITVVIGAIAFAALLPTMVLGMIPFIGPIISAAFVQAVVAFFTLLVVGEYLAARPQAAASSNP
ncbi:MAG: hypothetical protein ACXWNK_14505 [Vulcanimicrobiaceae bacterium]